MGLSGALVSGENGPRRSLCINVYASACSNECPEELPLNCFAAGLTVYYEAQKQL
jgi:hypothetical protein